MGLLDKAKDLASKAAEEAQKAAGAAKDKVDDVQARRKADDLASSSATSSWRSGPTAPRRARKPTAWSPRSP